jgi:hypothetical protein
MWLYDATTPTMGSMMTLRPMKNRRHRQDVLLDGFFLGVPDQLLELISKVKRLC